MFTVEPFFLKFLLDQGPFCGATDTLCSGLPMTMPTSFQVRVDQLSPTLFCHLRAMITGVIFGCRERASNPDRHYTIVPVRSH